MKWSLRLGRVAGIDLYVHATFLILLAWLAGSQYLQHQTLASFLSAAGFILLVFVIIILHELGHALAARRYGIETRDITLLPIGGVARLDRIPEDPKQELVVAFAGPLVNLVIAAALFVGILISSKSGARVHADDFVVQILWLNVWLAFFNLLPAFPMDGGRVLRAFLALRLTRERATEVAVAVGHVMALIFGAVGIFINPFLVFIAFFVWVGADGELQQVRVQSLLRGIPVADVMTRDFDSIRVDTPLGEVAKRCIPGFQQDYPVFDEDRLAGFISLDDIVRGISERGEAARAGDFLKKQFESAAPGESLDEVVSSWNPGSNSVLAVFDKGKLVGMLTAANIGEHMMIRSALKHSAQKSPGQLAP